jgi:hypothetical protein
MLSNIWPYPPLFIPERQCCTRFADESSLLVFTICCILVCRRKLSAYREAAQRQQRQQKLAALANKMAYEKQIMGKGRKRKLQAGDSSQPPVFLWKRERKK